MSRVRTFLICGMLWTAWPTRESIGYLNFPADCHKLAKRKTSLVTPTTTDDSPTKEGPTIVHSQTNRSFIRGPTKQIQTSGMLTDFGVSSTIIWVCLKMRHTSNLPFKSGTSSCTNGFGGFPNQYRHFGSLEEK